MDLEFRHLRDFLAVIEYGSLGDAARQLKTSQPTLTRSVKLLEKAIGGAVFDRTPHGMRPTVLGRALERRARGIIGEIGSARRELDDLIEARRGQVTVGTGPLFAVLILPRAVARFQEKYPKVDVSVFNSQMRETLPRVQAGEIDCTFHSAPHTLAPEFAHRVMLRGPKTVVITHRNNPLAAKRRVSLQDLAAAPWLMSRRPDYFRQRIENIFRRGRIVPPEPAVEFNSAIGAPYFLLESKRMVTVLHESFISGGAENEHLTSLNVPEFSWPIDSSVIYRRDAPLSPAAAKFVETVRAVCAEETRR